MLTKSEALRNIIQLNDYVDMTQDVEAVVEVQ
jgi:hypothetical protein